MTVSNTIRVHVTHSYAASAAQVFDAWLNPAMARTFLFAADNGRVIRAEIDPRVGGRFLIVDRRPTGDAFHSGMFLELHRPRKIVFSVSLEEHDHCADLVQIDIESLDVGCRLTLTHEMCAEWAEFEDRTRQGWTNIIENLGRVVDHQAAA
ncbi:SRPBCC domain-containing protein [Rhizobium sp. BK251]|uniref:SRPBCC family protein n=1 Tax=Rhizobium sp. BK251 TaxID=2512125 RepID=UPI001046A462|nr:SRPBCC domain-containing protein [Rhizobium sp. BK251]TCL70284.1 uncharacterized protein YndB with AHSA1/START domain [Rhizobium sp. BK251]